MSYHIAKIEKKTDTLKIFGFEERNPYIYPQDEQIIDFEITILGVKCYQTNKLYSFSDDADGKYEQSTMNRHTKVKVYEKSIVL